MSAEEANPELTTTLHLGLRSVVGDSPSSALTQFTNEASDEVEMTFGEKRAKTLNMLKQAADVFRVTEDLSQFKIVLNRGENTTEYPFWNQINGPIADALWHCGQVITFRRSSGNPYNSKASVFTGTVKQ